MMTEYQRETAFLKHCIRYHDTAERHKLEERITQLERDERCVRRAVWLMALLAALAMAALCYAAVFLADYPLNISQLTTRLLIKVFCALGIGSLVCLAAFVGLGVVYRKELDQRREHCRQLAVKLLESRLGKPRPAFLAGFVEDHIVAALKGAADIVQATVGAVTQILATRIKDSGPVGTSVTDAVAHVAAGTARAAVQVGADLGHAAKGIMLGVLRGTKEAGAEILDIVRHTAHVAIRGTAEAGADVEAVAAGLVAGAIDGAKELGIGAEDAAAAAADGALKAAGEVGATALSAVHKAVTNPVNGFKVRLTKPEITRSKNLSKPCGSI